MANSLVNPVEVATVLAEHYQNTFEVTYKHWEQRNRTFLYLLLTMAIASILALRIEGTEPLFIDMLASMLGITDVNRITELRIAFPFSLTRSLFLAAIFYLMANLFNRNYTLQRNYAYLGKLEDEIRELLQFSSSSIAFTREGAFYSKMHSRAQSFVGRFYNAIIGLLLAFFLGSRLWEDFTSQQWFFLSLDSVIALGAVFFYAAYAFAWKCRRKKST